MEGDSPVSVGDVLVGKYRVERVLGKGGMGVVLAARHLELDELVALKFMLPEALTDGDATARFTREARAAVRLKSAHVARVLDVGRLDWGAPYIVMEYLEGEDVATRLARRGRLRPEEAVDLVLEACEAVGEAHSLGIVHRDLKPSNLFVARRGDGRETVKVLDFGISKVTDAARPDLALTRTASVMGSPVYMSPEQMASSKDVDARSDVWSIGVILYELLSGACPFSAGTLPQLYHKVTTEAPESLPQLVTDVPLGLAAVVERCLEKTRDRRFASVTELAAALAPYASARGQRLAAMIAGDGTVREPSLVHAAPAPVAASTGAKTGTAWEGSSSEGRGRGAIVAFVAAAMVFAAMATLLVVHLATRPSSTSGTEATAHAVAATPPPTTPAPAADPAPVVAAAPTEPAASASPSASASSAPTAKATAAAPSTARPAKAGPAAKKPPASDDDAFSSRK